MIAALVALLGSSVAGCVPVSGADQLWRAGTRWVIVGEMHGTNEAPDAFANLICLAAASGRSVTVVLEYSSDDQAAIDAYLASDGGDQARAKLKILSPFASEAQDGRGSAAFLRLFDRLHQLKKAGRIRGVVAGDVGRSTPEGMDRNAAMARMWTAIPVSDRGVVLVLVGNIHAMRKPVSFSNHMIVTAGSLMPAKQTVTVNIEGSGGQEWNCQQDGCGPHIAAPSSPGVAGIVYSEDPDRQWYGSYRLGVPTTAASPAFPAEGASPSGKSPPQWQQQPSREQEADGPLTTRSRTSTCGEAVAESCRSASAPIADTPFVGHGMVIQRTGQPMRLPIRNYLSTPLTIFIEPVCDQYEVPAGGEAAVILEDGHPHSIDIHPENWVSIWNEGPEWATVEIFGEHQFPKPKREAE